MTRDELVEKMWYACVQECGKPSRAGMAAALRVCVDEVLGGMEKEEFGKALQRQYGSVLASPTYLEHEDASSLAAHVINFRRSRYLKSAEERVTVEHRNVLHSVYKDGKEIACFSDGSVADALRIGLIQQLKELEAHARL